MMTWNSLDVLKRANEGLDELIAERDAAIAELTDCRDALQDWQVAAGTRQRELDAARAEADALRSALVSVIDGWSEFDLEYYTGMDADEARRIIDLAYNRQ